MNLGQRQRKKSLHLKSDLDFPIFIPKSWCSCVLSKKKKRFSLEISLRISYFNSIINVFSKKLHVFEVDAKIPDIFKLMLKFWTSAD